MGLWPRRFSIPTMPWAQSEGCGVPVMKCSSASSGLEGQEVQAPNNVKVLRAHI